MPWQVEFRAGVWLPQIDWWLDAHFPKPRSFVSHAHSDHIAPHGEILCSAGTSRLMQARMPGERVEHVLPFGQGERLTPDCDVTLYPAGHIFGSAQALLLHQQHGRLLYTGDFKLRQGRSAEACATPRADVLVMETTFGRPHYVFPPTVQVLRDIAAFCHACLDDGEVPVLFGYSLGKSQELLSGLAEARLPILLHPQTLRLTRIYEELGMTFPVYRGVGTGPATGHVVICPPQAPDSTFLRQLGPRRTAMVTGWAMDPGAKYQYRCDAMFPLSDHADYPDLLRFVEAVQPKLVFTLHGFAQDFARTLRDRGVEAWAIGEDNQLEFGLAGRTEARPASAGTDADSAAAAPASPCEPGAANCFGRFAAVAEQVRATPRKLEKVEILRAYLTELSAADAATAVVFLTGRAFPQADGRVLTLGWAVIKRAVLEVAGLSEADYRAAYHRFADAGEAAEALLQRARPGQAHAAASPTLAAVAELFAEIAATRGPVAKLEWLQRCLAVMTPAEAKYLVKIVTGDLRIGLKEGLVEEAIAAATAEPTEAIRQANMLAGDIAEVTRAAREGRLGAIELRVFRPLQFMLASAEPTAEAILARLGAPVWLEEKYDGIRCQVHKAGDRAELYSRDLKRITEQFPDLVRGVEKVPGDFIVDGELLAWRDGRALPFAELQKRLGRKGDDFFLGAEIPVSISCYDLLWAGGRALLNEPLAQRRAELEQLLARVPAGAPLVLAPTRQAETAADIEAAFLVARQRGNEGLMAKDPSSAYAPGRRGLAWLKLKKAYATLDVVVVGVEYGHGKRRDVLSDYTFAIRDGASDRLLTVGKAYSGLTDLEIAAMTEHFLAHTVEERGRYRVVVPDTVLEVAFDTIQPSNRHQSGFALRFPRIVRIRTDKTPAEIDTLDTCRKLAAAAQSIPSQGTNH
ncbi:ATP-dependent DNA ligase [Opitutus sp. ER46]|uniref:ATP-dependent DNA ligase n=1 Tax=Opitutus sp. ER46 TaxID=2161864 RepID=UPI000D326A23|nr:ATP-dependent DNA ligase [Opitutus sp. ER46]PTX94308.1 DNA ligase [Opitutus sp. ER46]